MSDPPPSDTTVKAKFLLKAALKREQDLQKRVAQEPNNDVVRVQLAKAVEKRLELEQAMTEVCAELEVAHQWKPWLTEVGAGIGSQRGISVSPPKSPVSRSNSTPGTPVLAPASSSSIPLAASNNSNNNTATTAPVPSATATATTTTSSSSSSSIPPPIRRSSSDVASIPVPATPPAYGQRLRLEVPNTPPPSSSQSLPSALNLLPNSPRSVRSGVSGQGSPRSNRISQSPRSRSGSILQSDSDNLREEIQLLSQQLFAVRHKHEEQMEEERDRHKAELVSVREECQSEVKSYQSQMRELRDQAEMDKGELQRTIGSLEANLAAAHSSDHSNREDATNLSTRMEILRKEYEDASGAWSKHRTQFEQQVQRLQSELAEGQTRNRKKDTQIQELQQQCDALKVSLSSAESSAAELLSLQHTSKEYKELQKSYAAMRQENSDLRNLSHQTRLELGSVRQQLSDSEREVSQYSKELDLLRTQLSSLQSENHDIHQKLSVYTQAFTYDSVSPRSSNDIRKIQTELTNLYVKFTNTSATLRKCQSQSDQYQSQLVNATEELQQARSDLHAREHALEALKKQLQDKYYECESLKQQLQLKEEDALVHSNQLTLQLKELHMRYDSVDNENRSLKKKVEDSEYLLAQIGASNMVATTTTSATTTATTPAPVPTASTAASSSSTSTHLPHTPNPLFQSGPIAVSTTVKPPAAKPKSKPTSPYPSSDSHSHTSTKPLAKTQEQPLYRVGSFGGGADTEKKPSLQQSPLVRLNKQLKSQLDRETALQAQYTELNEKYQLLLRKIDAAADEVGSRETDIVSHSQCQFALVKKSEEIEQLHAVMKEGEVKYQRLIKQLNKLRAGSASGGTNTGTPATSPPTSSGTTASTRRPSTGSSSKQSITIQQQQQEIERLQKQVQHQRKEYAALLQSTKELRNTVSQVKSENEQLRNSLPNIQKLIKQYDEVEFSEEVVRFELSTLISTINEEVITLHNSYSELNAQFIKSQSQLQQREKQLVELQELQPRSAKLQADYQLLKVQYDTLQLELHSLKSSSGDGSLYQRVHDECLRWLQSLHHTIQNQSKPHPTDHIVTNSNSSSSNSNSTAKRNETSTSQFKFDTKQLAGLVLRTEAERTKFMREHDADVQQLQARIRELEELVSQTHTQYTLQLAQYREVLQQHDQQLEQVVTRETEHVELLRRLERDGREKEVALQSKEEELRQHSVQFDQLYTALQKRNQYLWKLAKLTEITVEINNQDVTY